MWMCGFDLVDQEVLSHSMVHQSLFCTYFECLASRRGSDFNRTHAARVLLLVHALPEAVYGCTFDLTLLRVLEDYSTPVLGWSHVFDRAFGFYFLPFAHGTISPNSYGPSRASLCCRGLVCLSRVLDLTLARFTKCLSTLLGGLRMFVNPLPCSSRVITPSTLLRLSCSRPHLLYYTRFVR